MVLVASATGVVSSATGVGTFISLRSRCGADILCTRWRRTLRTHGPVRLRPMLLLDPILFPHPELWRIDLCG
jgi:hypothetical protein